MGQESPTQRQNRSPSYAGLEPASPRARAAARGASRKRDTQPERLLGSALWQQGLRYRKDVAGIPGRPDLVFSRARVAVFCDGDFWHGKDWEQRRAKLAAGTNPSYWLAKVAGNIARDREQNRNLRRQGWTVLRFWESDIRADPERIAARVRRVVETRLDKARQNRRK
ncbi:MAG: very short patch repair endonuclease [Acidobacteria bacterium]|nr:very short patch repair endonuclease [Thermoanaerobaculia bacterium]MBP7812978.1 very short patch repair endonuclease [Thermoanaerobaculia bacterium]NLN12373.1 very short patch repair endonuclease [Acidobacteriota bacterium]